MNPSSSHQPTAARHRRPTPCPLRLLVLGWLTFLWSSALFAQQAGSLEPSFALGAAGVDGSVNAVLALPDGKIIVGGQFLGVDNISAHSIARLNADGSLDETFKTPLVDTAPSAGPSTYPAGTVSALALDSQGRILVGGLFDLIGGVAHANLARLTPDGFVDPTFNPSVVGSEALAIYTAGGGVYALAVQADDKVVVGGGFDSVNGETRRAVVRLNTDGSRDESFNPGFSTAVDTPDAYTDYVMQVALGPAGEVYIAGGFRSIQGVARNFLARLNAADGSLDASFAPRIGVYDSVSALACAPDGRVLVGGSFPQPGSSDPNSYTNLARLNADGSPDVAFTQAQRNTQPSREWSLEHIIVQPRDGSILLGGYQLIVNNLTVGTVGRYLPDGRVDKTFFSGVASRYFPARARALALGPDGTVFVGGDFSSVDGQPRLRLTALRGVPSADCPIVSVQAKVPSALVDVVGQRNVQDGRFIINALHRGAAALGIQYSVKNKTVPLNEDWPDGTSLTIPAGKRKAKLRVQPGATFFRPGDKHLGSVILTLEAGRGYAVGTDQAKVRVRPTAP